MTSTEEKPESIYKEIQNLLLNAVNNRSSAFHTPVFSNISENNLIQSRTIVLRKFNNEKLTLTFHSDMRSPKIHQLKKKNNSCFLFYDTKIKIQLRIKTTSKINNQNQVTKKAWDNTSLASRKCYLTNQPPSSLTDKPQDGIPEHLSGIDPKIDESELGYKNFAVIENSIQNIEWLHLNYLGHKRLNIKLENLVPEFNWIIP